MKKSVLLFLVISVSVFGQVNFDDYFENKTLRIDYYHTGDAVSDEYSFDELIEEPYWGGPKTSLIDIFNYGKYKVEVTDAATGTVLYTHHYATLFSEWQTTDEADRVRKSFPESVIVPYPKNNVIVNFYSRDRENNLHKKFEMEVDPSSFMISKERRKEFPSFKVHYSGDPAEKVDIVIIPEGYTKAEMILFENNCNDFANYLFNTSPFRENKNNFNIWGVEAVSDESGTDIPGNNVWKKTVVNSSFYTFGLERYLMVEDYQGVRDVAANAPYDQIYVLVNSSKYGGGAIYNFYSVSINKNTHTEYVIGHEFGHGFAGLGDEYFTSDVAYNEFYPTDVEPLDPNLTTLVNFNGKWEDLIDEDTPVPTPSEEPYLDKVGVFEGGGYVAKGVYRPRYDCQMHTITIDNFCPVCKRAIQAMIDFYTE